MLFESFRFPGTDLNHQNLLMQRLRMCAARGSVMPQGFRFLWWSTQAMFTEEFAHSAIASLFTGKKKRASRH